MKSELLSQKTLGGILNTLDKYYDMNNCEIGSVTKGLLVTKLDSLVNMTRCKAKKEYQ